MLKPVFRPFAVALGAALALAGVVAPMHAAAPAEAATPAGAIVFIKNHNVWIARGDGSGQVAVTSGGKASSPYRTPTRSDDGTFVAAKGAEIVRLDRDGKLIKKFSAPTLTSSVNYPIGGQPQYVSASPDGKSIAYTQIAWQCPIGWSCGYRYATGYTTANGTAKGNSTYFRAPSWLSNTRTVQSGGYGSHAMLHTLGTSAVNWFNDDDVYPTTEDLGDLEVSRDGKWLIALRSHDADTHVVWYRVNGSPATQTPPPPTAMCTTSTDPAFASPTLAPDGSAAAWEEGDGIWIKQDLTNCDSPQPALRIAGGSEPSWSQAAYRAPAKPLIAKSAPRISGSARVGNTLRASKGAWNATPTSYSYQWKRNGKSIPGKTGSSYRPVKSDAGKRISVAVTAKRTGYTSAAKTSRSTAIALYNAKRPSISGTAKVGRKLAAKRGSWAGSPSKYAYQWYRNSTRIPGATKSAYRVSAKDHGKKLRVKVTAKRSGYPSTAAYASYTKKVKR